MEELVAEMGSAFLCADLGITPEVMPDHASYLDSWLKVLKADPKAIFTATAHAERAAEYLHRLQPTETVDVPPATSPEATASYEKLTEAMERYDFLTAREQAERLKACIDNGGTYPAGQSKLAVDTYLKAAFARSIYPD